MRAPVDSNIIQVRYVPEWFPGTGWKQTAKDWHATLQSIAERPYAFVKHQMAQGKDTSSFVSHLISGGDLTAEDEFNTKWSALSMYAGGADTVCLRSKASCNAETSG